MNDLLHQSTVHGRGNRRTRPRLGFLGVGWIGRHRLEAVARSGHADIIALADANPAVLAEAGQAAPDAEQTSSLDELLDLDLDGVVIATPSALHAEQAERSLAAGRAVFCQKPLGRSAAETRRVVDAARQADRLLGVDLSYRHIRGVQAARRLVRDGTLGKIFAADLVFHNAYGPDKEWFYNPKLSGGGCVMDLGIHLVDLALWALGDPAVEEVTSRLFCGGELLRNRATQVEDYAAARINLAGGTVLQVACSWKLPAGQDARIEANFYGTHGGVSVHNVNGSFYEFAAERLEGTRRTTLTDGPEDWGGGAILAWTRRLADGGRFDASAQRLVEVAEILDAIYDGHSFPVRFLPIHRA